MNFLWYQVIYGQGWIFITIPEKAFAGHSVMTVVDLLQLPQVIGKLIFSQFCDKDSIKHLLGSQLWHFFKYAELTEVARQNDELFIDLLNKVRVGNIDNDVKKLLKARVIHVFDENSKRCLAHVCRE